MSDYSIAELEKWNGEIERLARNAGLCLYDQEFEIVSYEDMIGYEAYAGMPSHYPHWSFGKAYEKLKTLNRYNLSGLPYEMVINSNPCIAYLMKDNTLLLQILTIAHVYGHNDFFKNNRLFRQGTRAAFTVEMFKSHADRLRSYISDPGIGYAKVERIMDAAHSLRFQTSRVIGEKRLDEEERRRRLIDRSKQPESEYPLLDPPHEEEGEPPDFRKQPPEPEEDLLLFVTEYGRLAEWEKDLLDIVREETLYFIPQIETKIMNEGWASFWHYRLLNGIGLPQGLQMEFIKRHNQVVRPFEGQINPYFLGFKIFEDLQKRNGGDTAKLFEARELERDESFIRRYLTAELCRELNLYEYEKNGSEYVVSEIADEEGWTKVRDTIAANSGMGGIPVIRVEEKIRKDNTILLEHLYDGRELELNYAYETLKYLAELWEGRVMLVTVIDGKKRMIVCDEHKRISLT